MPYRRLDRDSLVGDPYLTMSNELGGRYCRYGSWSIWVITLLSRGTGDALL